MSEYVWEEQAGRIFDLAAQVAIEMGHRSINSGHVLVALILFGDSLATLILERFDVGADNIDEVKAAVIELAGLPYDPVLCPLLPTVDAYDSSKYAYMIAEMVGRDGVYPEHILFGFYGHMHLVDGDLVLGFDGNSRRLAAHVLREMGVDSFPLYMELVQEIPGMNPGS